ncbi:MAG TPA: hypothetical protein VNL91_05450, partial [Thermoanaerobaculia bacterium]|nr:hypothetical protein [Thermoanaerobaculia bacterium]
SFYEALIERDLESVPAAVRTFRESHSSDDLFLAVARFAVLAWAPSQHAKHALLCCLAAHDLREELGDRFDDALTECAIYAAQSRPPWSEPPITHPPETGPGHDGSIGELRAAVAALDRLRGERWLAGRHRDRGLAADYFAVASEDFEDLGHKLIVSTAAWRLAERLGEQGRYATLRIGVWEMTSYRGPAHEERGCALEARALLDRLIAHVIDQEGSPIASHALFLFDAAIEAADIAGDASIERRVRDHLTAAVPAPVTASTPPAAGEDVPLYRFARDYGQCFKSHAVAKRLAARFPDADVRAITAATRHHLEHAPSFEEWSFA